MTPDFDLFGDQVPSSDARKATLQRRTAADDEALATRVLQLVAAGLTRLAIAREVGIAPSTLYANFFSEIGVRAGRPGRRAHVPTKATRADVARMAAADAPVPMIATTLGISPPTLRRHYAVELSTRRPK